MMDYVKLCDGVVVYAPDCIEKDDVVFSPLNDELSVENGYKVLSVAKMPEVGCSEMVREVFTDSGDVVVKDFVVVADPEYNVRMDNMRRAEYVSLSDPIFIEAHEFKLIGDEVAYSGMMQQWLAKKDEIKGRYPKVDVG